MITTIGHDRRVEVEQIIQLFFDLHSDYEAVSELRGGVLHCAVTRGDKTARAEYPVPSGADKKTFADCVKKSVFLACRKISDMPAPWGISTGIRPAKTARIMLDEGSSDEEILKFMTDEYWTEPDRAALSLEVAKRERTLLQGLSPKAVSLYIGVPFCPTRCAYCSFVSQALSHNNKFMLPYVDACEKEIYRTAELVAQKGRVPVSVYFGGGTPTALPPEQLRRLIMAVKSAFDMSAVLEFTVEAGRPDTFTPEMTDMLAKSGVTRISINPQTMHQCTLDAIGRRHSAEDVVRAFELARGSGISSINADLIVGLPGETPDMVRETLEKILALRPEAVTVHTMYMKRAARLKTDFEKYRFATDVNEMMAMCREYMKNYGANPYYMYKQKNTLGNLENVGFALPGHECLYNIYIMEEIHTIVAMGAGASSKTVRGDRIERFFNPKEAGDYVNRLDEVLRRKELMSEQL
ncbi:MAG: coproporphyrinogen dehydrogenase HemZ [Oscillospiraceae bacterium]|nr:coproporphyrinogen dehydrogenase HemZ [Oscillospiraceae bacterium]